MSPHLLPPTPRYDPWTPAPHCLSTQACPEHSPPSHFPASSARLTAASLQIDQMFAAFPPDVTGNLDYKNLVHIITHGEEKD